MNELRVPNTQIRGQARAELATTLATRYLNGTSIRQLSTELGRSYGFVRALLLEAGVELRAKGGARQRKAGGPWERRS